MGFNGLWTAVCRVIDLLACRWSRGVPASNALHPQHSVLVLAFPVILFAKVNKNEKKVVIAHHKSGHVQGLQVFAQVQALL